jgi:hypothetical protein
MIRLDLDSGKVINKIHHGRSTLLRPFALARAEGGAVVPVSRKRGRKPAHRKN